MDQYTNEDILAAADEYEEREELRRMLEGAGFELDPVIDGEFNLYDSWEDKLKSEWRAAEPFEPED